MRLRCDVIRRYARTSSDEDPCSVQNRFMRTHHTKTKGDLGVMAAAYDLTKKGFIVCNPMTEHAPFDLVAYANGQCLRIQVKYRAATKGVCFVRFYNFWADRHGVHSTKLDKSEIDLICVYCPDTERSYYLDPSVHGESASRAVGEQSTGRCELR